MLRLFSDIQVMLEQIGVFRTSCKARARCARRLFPGETPCPVVTGRCPGCRSGPSAPSVVSVPLPKRLSFARYGPSKLLFVAVFSIFLLFGVLF